MAGVWPKASANAAQLLLLVVVLLVVAFAMPASAAPRRDSQSGLRLRFVLILSRHGVRSPTSTPGELNRYSVEPWPEWQVPSGDLTPHGYELLRLFGAYDRMYFADTGLLSASGCGDAANVYIWADTEQRTMATGHALADGLMPGCALMVHSLPSGGEDPLFHPLAAGAVSVSKEKMMAAVEQRIQDDPALPTRTNAKLLEQMQRVLRGCAIHQPCSPGAPMPETPLLQIPATLQPNSHGNDKGKKGDQTVTLRGPLAVASSLSENFLLEYVNGDPLASVGWGVLTGKQVAGLIALHTAYFDLMHRTSYVAQAEASNLLYHVLQTLAQARSGRPVAGALGLPTDKLALVIGHDTNLAAIASLLKLSWTADGRLDDTPPGAELHFELWQDAHARYFVRLTYSVQTLKQMRTAAVLSPKRPPSQVNLATSACAAAGQTCWWEDFNHSVDRAIDPLFTTASPY